MINILRHPNFIRLTTVGIAFILIGAVLFMVLEGWSFIDALYFTVATVLTVGYGDFYVTHNTSKIVAIFYMFLVVPFVLGYIQLMAEIVHDRVLSDHRS